MLDVRDGYAERDSQGHYIVGSGGKYRELKEMKSLESKMETQRPVFNLVSPVAQATEMAKSELKRKGEDSIMDFGLEFIEILKDEQQIIESSEKKTPNPPKRRERTVLKKRVHPRNGIYRALRRATPLKTGSRSELRKKTTRK